MNAGPALVAAVCKVTLPTGVAVAAGTCEKSDTDTLIDCPAMNIIADRIDAADNFVPWYARILDIHDTAIYRPCIGMAYTAGFDTYAYFAPAGRFQRSFDSFKQAWLGHLHCYISIHVHSFFPSYQPARSRVGPLIDMVGIHALCVN
jgi:hypothetical protein